MLDLELLRSFVSVVDSGGFTRAGERVHRTQSTVSQQIKRLEDDIGQPLLNRTGKSVTPTEAGERLLSYARRLLALAEEARDVLARPTNEGAVRLGIPEDFAAYRLAKLLASCSRSRPGLRLDVRADQSVFLRRDLDRGELDLALLKRNAGEKGGIAVWPERVHWVTSKSRPVDTTSGSVPLIGFPPGCLYRARAIHALESAGRAWHMAYASSGLAGIQAAVAAGLGLSILSEMSIQADHRMLTAKDGFAPIDKTEVALMASPDASPATLRLADRLAEFCNKVQAKAARADSDFGGDHTSEIGRQRGVVVARNPDPVAPHLQRRERIAVGFGQPLMGGAVMKTVAECNHHARVVPRDDSGKATECRHRIVRRQQHAARREAGAFFQVQIRDHEQALLFPEQGAREIGNQAHVRDVQRRSSNDIDCSSRHGHFILRHRLLDEFIGGLRQQLVGCFAIN